MSLTTPVPQPCNSVSFCMSPHLRYIATKRIGNKNQIPKIFKSNSNNSRMHADRMQTQFTRGLHLMSQLFSPTVILVHCQH